jgi:hypothetical protein
MLGLAIVYKGRWGILGRIGALFAPCQLLGAVRCWVHLVGRAAEALMVADLE